MSASPTAVAYDIVIALDRFRQGLRQQESEAAQSARRVADDTRRIADQAARNQPAPQGLNPNGGRSLDAAQRADESYQRARRNAQRGVNQELQQQRSLNDDVLGATIKIGAVVKVVQGLTQGVVALTETWKGNSDAIRGNAESAAKHYSKAAEAIGNIPVIGNIANAVSGDAIGASQKALADTEANNAKTIKMAKDRADAERAAANQIRAARISTLDTDEQAVASEQERLRLAIQQIDISVKEKQIGHFTGEDLKNAQREQSAAALKRLEIARFIQKTEQGTAEQIAALDEQIITAGTEREREAAKRQKEEIEFEQQLRIAEVQASQQGAQAKEQIEAANNQKRITRQIAVAKQIADAELKIEVDRANAQAEQDKAIQEDLANIIERDRAEQEAADDVRFEASQRDLETTHKTVTAQVNAIEHDADRAREKARREGAGKDTFAALAENEASQLRSVLADLKKPTLGVGITGASALTTNFGLGSTDAEDLKAIQQRAENLLKQIARNTEDNTPKAA